MNESMNSWMVGLPVGSLIPAAKMPRPADDGRDFMHIRIEVGEPNGYGARPADKSHFTVVVAFVRREYRGAGGSVLFWEKTAQAVRR